MTTRAKDIALRTMFGGVFLALGLTIIFFLGQTSALVCYRFESNRIDCRLERDLLGIGLGETEIHQLQSAELEVSDSDKYRVILVTNSGNFPLTGHYSSGRPSKQKIADRINAFIANPSQLSLQIQRLGWRGWIWGGAMLLIGVLLWKSVKADIGEKKRSFGRIGR